MQVHLNKIKKFIGYRFSIHVLYIFNHVCVSFEMIDNDNMNIILVTVDTNKYKIDYNKSETVYNVLEISHNDTSNIGNYIRHLNTNNDSKYSICVKNSRELYYISLNTVVSVTYVSNYTYKTFRYVVSVDFEYMLKHRQTIQHDTEIVLSSLYSSIDNRQYTTNNIKNILTTLQSMDKIHTYLDRKRNNIHTQIDKILVIYRDINENEQRIQHKINMLKSQGVGKPSIKGIHKDLDLGKQEYILYKKLSEMRNVKDDTIKQYNILKHRYDHILLVTDRVNHENSKSLNDIQTNLTILSEN